MTFAIQMRNPRAGWLDASIQFDGQSFEFSFSDVAADTLCELAELALFLLSDTHFGCVVTFWLEPDGYELRAKRDKGLTLSMAHAESAFGTLFPPIRNLGSICVNGPFIAGEIVRALKEIESQIEPCNEADEATTSRSLWAHPYPVNLVDQLETALSWRLL